MGDTDLAKGWAECALQGQPGEAWERGSWWLGALDVVTRSVWGAGDTPRVTLGKLHGLSGPWCFLWKVGRGQHMCLASR
jgi:hypothetical protein